jgi:hypothetical protein
MVAVPLMPRATFSGESGWRNPGVTVTVALDVPVPEVSMAFTVTCTLLAVRYGGGVYWPVLEMDPAPVLASPPLTAQVTEAAPPPLRVAVNCSYTPELEEALQPVQLVSMVAVPDETENVPPPPPPPPEADPPQPARRTRTGTAAAASIRAGRCRSKLDPCRCKGLSTRRPRERKSRRCGTVVTDSL